MVDIIQSKIKMADGMIEHNSLVKIVVFLFTEGQEKIEKDMKWKSEPNTEFKKLKKKKEELIMEMISTHKYVCKIK